MFNMQQQNKNTGVKDNNYKANFRTILCYLSFLSASKEFRSIKEFR